MLDELLGQDFAPEEEAGGGLVKGVKTAERVGAEFLRRYFVPRLGFN
jgi:hypothetical protein